MQPKDAENPSRKSRLWYWREERFRTLAELVEILADDPELAGYVEYLRFRERGLRKRAFDSLNRFIASVLKTDLGQRIHVVDRLMQCQYERAKPWWDLIPELIPDPLRRELILPTLDEWIRSEPINPVPLRWRGTDDDLRRAATIDPNEQIARVKLCRSLLMQVDVSTHELPHGYIHGSFPEDVAKLDEVESVLSALSSAESESLRKWFEALHKRLNLFGESSVQKEP